MRLFIKRFFNFFLLLLIFLNIFSFNVFSQEPTPTPEEGTLGGKCKVGDVNLNEMAIPKITTEEDKDENKWGCLRILFTDICISNFFESSQKSAINFLNKEGILDQLNALGVCQPGLEPSTLDIKDPNCICINRNDKDLARISDILCNRYINQEKPASEKLKSKEFVSCSNCFANGGYWSGLGCIYFSNWQTFFEKNVFGLLIGLAGIISLFCIIYAAFQIQTSSGNAEKVKKAQELLTSCIMGLMLIIFSVFILKLIGVDILKIPGFSSK
jgi:hypothetical protein